jgi:ribosomal protein S21
LAKVHSETPPAGLLAKNIFYGNLRGHMAKTVIQVSKNPNENNASVLRRFSRKVQESGIIHKVKGNRYNERKESKLKVKKSALKRMARRKEIETLKKMGKMGTKTR